jgi:hypothetical protein
VVITPIQGDLQTKTEHQDYEQLENGVFPIKFFRPTKIVLDGLVNEYLEMEGK